MKKIFAVLLCLLFVGCSSNTQNEVNFDEMDLRSRIVYVFSQNKIDLRTLSVEDGIVKISKDAYVDNEKYIRSSIYNDVKEMCAILKTSDEVEEVRITWYAELVNFYGNREDEAIAAMEFTRETMDLIDFDNVPSANIPELADKYWEHKIFGELGI